MSVNFSHTVCSLLDFLTLEHGTDMLSQNVDTTLLLDAVLYLRTAEIAHNNLAVKTLDWLCIVRFRAVQFRASYANLG